MFHYGVNAAVVHEPCWASGAVFTSQRKPTRTRRTAVLCSSGTVSAMCTMIRSPRSRGGQTVSVGCEKVLGVATEFEIALVSVAAGWALSTVSSGVGTYRSGWQAKHAARAAELAEAGKAVEALVSAFNACDLASRGVASQSGRRTRIVEGFGALADLVDGYRQQRPAAGMAHALGRALEFDRRIITASNEFINGPLHAMTAAHPRMTMIAGGFPELMAAADVASDAATGLMLARVHSRPAAEQQTAQDAMDAAVGELGHAWRRLGEPVPVRWRRLLPGRKPNRPPTA